MSTVPAIRARASSRWALGRIGGNSAVHHEPRAVGITSGAGAGAEGAGAVAGSAGADGVGAGSEEEGDGEGEGALGATSSAWTGATASSPARRPPTTVPVRAPRRSGRRLRLMGNIRPMITRHPPAGQIGPDAGVAQAPRRVRRSSAACCEGDEGPRARARPPRRAPTAGRTTVCGMVGSCSSRRCSAGRVETAPANSSA